MSCSLSSTLLEDIVHERKRSENPEAMDEDDSDEVAEIKAAHFEESMKYAQKVSVMYLLMLLLLMLLLQMYLLRRFPPPR